MVLTQFELRGWEGLHVDPWAAWLLLSRNVLLVLLLVVLRARTPEPHHVVRLGLAFAAFERVEACSQQRDLLRELDVLVGELRDHGRVVQEHER